MISFLKKLQKKFKARSIKHLAIIFIIFSISGSLTLYLSFPIIKFLNITNYFHNYFIQILIRLIIIFPLYQIVLIFVGILFGEMKYFIEFEKKFFKKIFSRTK